MCDFNENANNAEVEEYLKSFMVNETRTCHVNKDNQWQVILNKSRGADVSVYFTVLVTLIIICQFIFLVFVRNIYDVVTSKQSCKIIQGGNHISNELFREKLLQK